MDAGGGSSDRERGWFDSGANGAKLGPSAMAGGAPGDPAQSGAETFSTRLCNSLPSPHDERVLLQNKAQGKNPLNKSHTVRCLIKCIQIIVGLFCASLCASGSLCHAQPERRVHILISLLWNGLIPGEPRNTRRVHGEVPRWKRYAFQIYCKYTG